MKLLVVHTEHAGRSSDAGTAEETRAGRLREMLLERGAQSEFTEPDRKSIKQRLDTGRFDRVIAAGGDGTAGLVAQLVAGTRMPMAVLPLGTCNHFAKDAGIPMRIDDAMETSLTGTVHQLDAAEVNGRVFVNNASLGFSPQLIEERERRRADWPRHLGNFFTGLEVVRQKPVLTLTIRNGPEVVRCRSPLLMVGNNRYLPERFRLGRRTALDEGILSVFVPRFTSGWRLLWLLLLAVFGNIRSSRGFDYLEGTKIVVEPEVEVAKVALDGEVIELTPPLVFRSRPKALALIK